ncbi:MAG TPA: hypothetical protein VMU10_12875 [Desulfomonilia bacterium]|nr:hypothetical protein [Desulfomonilia bacterium]
MEEHTGRGIIESGSRALEELLAKTAFKDSLRLWLLNIDPENSPQFVRTLMGRDIEVPLALVSAMPALANCLIKAVDEVLAQIRDKFPKPLLAGFISSLLEEIDADALGRAIKNAGALSEDLAPIFRAAWKSIEERGHAHGEDK